MSTYPMPESMADKNRAQLPVDSVMRDFMQAVPAMTASQIALAMNALTQEAYKRMMA